MIRCFLLSFGVLWGLCLTGTIHGEEKKAEIPEGYVMQVMEPTGGKILRPKDWHYYEGHTEDGWVWTISQEDTQQGKARYDTGVRIQVIPSVQEKTGKSGEDFLKEFIAKKKAAAQVVHKTCEEQAQGMFTRICLEITEGEYRILYSLFWGNGMDLAVISIAGAKREDWEANAKTFNLMSAFELIDMKRFEDGEK